MEGKKKGKKKKKAQGGKKVGVDVEAREQFQRILGVYYKKYDMLEVSRLLGACVCLLVV